MRWSIRIIITLLVSAFLTAGLAQTNEANYNLSSGEAVAVDAAGNIYVAGSVIVNLVFGPGRDNDVFLAKFDTQGNQLWMKQFGTKEVEAVAAIAVDTDENIFVLGDTRGNLKNTNAGEINLYLAKFDKNGKQLWLEQRNNHSGRGINHLDVTDSVMVTATVMNEIYTEGLVVIQFDAEGRELRSTILNFDKRSAGTVHVDPVGNVIAAGSSWTGEFTGPQDVTSYISKFDSEGKQLWTQNLGDGGSTITDIVIDKTGISFITGWTISDSLGERDYEPTHQTITFGDAFLASYDKDGQKRWIKQFGADSSYSGEGVVVDSLGNAIVVGYGNGYVGGEPIGASDAFVVKYDAKNGNQVWAQRLGTEDFDGAMDVTIDTNNYIYMTGYLNQTWDDLRKNDGVSFNAGHFTFLAKYTPDGEQVWLRTFEYKAPPKQ
jgi:Beta-propeller repeat